MSNLSGLLSCAADGSGPLPDPETQARRVTSRMPRGATQLSPEPEGIAGLVVPAPDGYSKRQRIEAALENRTQQESAGLTLKFAGDRKDNPLEVAGRKVLEAVERPLTQIKRRDLARTWPRQHEHLAVVEGWEIRLGSVVSIPVARRPGSTAGTARASRPLPWRSTGAWPNMADDKSKVGGQDRSRVAGEQDYEVQHFAEAEGISIKQARDLIDRFGNDRDVLGREARKLKA